MPRAWLVASVSVLLVACAYGPREGMPTADDMGAFGEGDSGVESATDPGPEVRLVSPAGEIFSLPVEIADEPGKWSRGLMFRDSLVGGMLFVFPDEEPRSFWMKNTRIPLDILYFDADGNLDSVRSMRPCKKDPCPMYRSAGPARFALEVNAGVAEEHGVGVGWRLEYP
jgi:uncharacterized membrane protein (UPF0127 family)